MAKIMEEGDSIALVYIPGKPLLSMVIEIIKHDWLKQVFSS